MSLSRPFESTNESVCASKPQVEATFISASNAASLASSDFAAFATAASGCNADRFFHCPKTFTASARKPSENARFAKSTAAGEQSNAAKRTRFFLSGFGHSP